MPRPGHVKAATAAVVLIVATGCQAFPSDPAPPSFGARVVSGRIEVKVPVCPDDPFSRIEITDFEDDASPNPRVLWWASAPSPQVMRTGRFTPWSGAGFAQSSRTRDGHRPAVLDISVQYGSEGDSRGGVVDREEVARADLKDGEYWAGDSALTARQIDAQLGCEPT